MNVSVPARRSASGFTLIELLIALVITAFVLGGITMAFYRTTSEALRLRDVTDRRQSARTAVQLVERMIWLTSLTGLAMVTLLLVYFAMHRKVYTDLHELTDKESPVEVAR